MTDFDLDQLVEQPLHERPKMFGSVHQIITRLCAVIGLLCLIGSGLIYYNYTKSEAKIEIIEIAEPDQKQTKDIQVDISGAIRKPGLYKLSANARVGDIITLAEGFLDDAHTEWIQKNLNLAAALKDGQKIYIPYIDEPDVTLTTVLQKEIDSNKKISINRASIEELESLPKIGKTTATKIVEFRNAHGQFTDLNDLLQIDGIGEGTLNNLRDLVILDP